MAVRSMLQLAGSTERRYQSSALSLLRLVALVLAASLLAACRPSPTPCASAGTCPDGEECLANRCVTAGGQPVGAADRRVVLEPTQVTVVDRHAEVGEPLPSTVTFGSHQGGKTLLYLRFAPTPRRGRLRAAFLVLEPAVGAAQGSVDVSVTAWRIVERWQQGEVSWLAPLALEPPSARGIARPSPASVLRVDVTQLVEASTRQQSDHGIALVSSGGADLGASYATGGGLGARPRLELYWSEARPARGPAAAK